MTIKAMKSPAFVGALAGAFLGTSAIAAEFEKIPGPGTWTIFCAKGGSPAPDRCSLMKSAEQHGVADASITVGFNFTDDSIRPLMTIITPQINYLKDGVAIGADGRQLGRAFIDACDGLKCQINLQLDDRLLSELEAARYVDFEYQINDTKGSRLHVDFAGFADGEQRLRSLAGNSLRPILSVSDQRGTRATVKIEIRASKVPTEGMSDVGVGELLKTCEGGPATKDVFVKDGQISEGDATMSWIKANLACNPNALVINLGTKSDKGQTQAAGSIVQDEVSRQVPKVDLIAEDGYSRLPFRFNRVLFPQYVSPSPK